MCAADQAILADTALRERMIANSAELYRQGGRGMYDEGSRARTPVGSSSSRRCAVPVYLWHGERDETVPLAMANYLARAIPTATSTFDSQEGHHLLYSRWPEILAALT